MSSTTYSLRPCKICGSYPRWGYYQWKASPVVVELSCGCHSTNGHSESVAAVTWNAMNLPDEKPRE